MSAATGSRRASRRTVIGVLSLVLAYATQAASAPEADGRQAAVDEMFARYDRPGTPGMVIGVYKDGRILYTRGYGYADLTHGVRVTPQTRFHIASTSKQFTAFAVALLAREGKIDLDADIRLYLPEVPDFGHPVRVRHLISHTSGLREQGALGGLAGHDDEGMTQQQVLNLIHRQRALNFRPGSAFQYSNTNYTLLAEAVRRVSGQTFRQFTSDRIFRPLGMAHTFFSDDRTEIVPNLASSYQSSEDVGGGWKRWPHNGETVGTTGVVTTAEDLLKWAGNLAHPTVGDASLIRQMATPWKLDDGTPVNYGFALMRRKFAGHDALMHLGGTAGYRSIFAWFPDSDFSVVMLTAAPHPRVEPVEAIVRLYLGAVPQQGLAAPREAQIIKPDRALREAAAGHYLRRAGKMTSITLEGDELVWRTPGMPPAKLVFRSDGTFNVGDEEWRPSYCRFQRDATGRVTGIEESGLGGAITPHRRVDPASPSPAQLAQLAGSYYSPELDISYRFSVESGRLVARSMWTTRPIVFVPSIADRFDSTEWSDWAMATVEFHRDEAGRPTGLEINALEVGIGNLRLDRVRDEAAN